MLLYVFRHKSVDAKADIGEAIKERIERKYI